MNTEKKVSKHFENMCAIGHGCGLTTLQEAFRQIESHWDAFFDIKTAHKELNELWEEVKSFPMGTSIIDAMGKEFCDKVDKDMEELREIDKNWNENFDGILDEIGQDD